MQPNDRHTLVTNLLDTLFDRATSEGIVEPPSLTPHLDALFATTTWGFREIILLSAIGRYIDPTYSPYTAFYDCNPRLLYEGPIRAALRVRKIPTRKSGALNVAKAAKGINEEWAAQRRPAHGAAAVVHLIRYMETLDQAGLKDLITILLVRFLGEAQRVSALVIRLELNDNPSRIYELCRRLINEQPDRGNTPQRIIGLLLQSYHTVLKTGVAVFGHNEEASVTNTTSKKPADIIEGVSKNQYYVLYEITVKPFNEARLIDSYESISKLVSSEQKSVEVIVLCRPQDTHEEAVKTVVSDIYLGELEYEHITYQFVNLYEWILGQLLRMPPQARLMFYDELQAYINDPNTSEKVKELWASIHLAISETE